MSDRSGDKKILYQLMSFLDGIKYSVADDTINFSRERPGAITADDIVRFFHFKAYGIQDPVEDDSGPPRCQVMKLIYYQQALVHTMPQGQMEWDDSGEHCWNQGGNPAHLQ